MSLENELTALATRIAVEVKSKPSTSEAMVVVEHGANANTARPAGAVVVYWVGTADPVNATSDDLWNDLVPGGSGDGGGGAPVMELCILTKSAAAVQDVGGMSGGVAAPVYWTWDGETRKDSEFTHSNTVNSSRVAVAETGWYEISFVGNVQAPEFAGRTTTRGVYRVNGGPAEHTGSSRSYGRGIGTTTNDMGSPMLTAVIPLTAGDYVEVGSQLLAADRPAGVLNTTGSFIEDDNHNFTVKRIS